MVVGTGSYTIPVAPLVACVTVSPTVKVPVVTDPGTTATK
jgi:hypothetical protein